MKKTCEKCNAEMIDNCNVSAYVNLFIVQRRRGLLPNIGEPVKGAVCPNCGNINFYVINVKRFIK